MKLLFKQRFFSWFDSYDIYDENDKVIYTVEGKLSWGHCLHIIDRSGRHVGTVKEKVLTFLPRFELYENGSYIGDVKKELTFFTPRFRLEFKGWDVEGDIFQWSYEVVDGSGRLIASAEKRLFNWTDTYEIDVVKPEDALYSLMIVLAIDAAKCSQNN